MVNTSPHRGSDGKYHFLYKTTNRINSKIYLGKHTTKKLNDGYRGSGDLLKAAILKYGYENFSTEFLSFYDNKLDVALAEKDLISDEIVDSANYYNLVRGGVGGDSRNFYRNSTPRQNALKAAETIKSRPNSQAIRNSKIKSKINDRVKIDPTPFILLARKMNAIMRGATKENSEHIRKQIQNRKMNHAVKMKILKSRFLAELQIINDIRTASKNVGISASTGYRFARSIASNGDNAINIKSNFEEMPL